MANRNLIYKGKGQDEKLGNYSSFIGFKYSGRGRKFCGRSGTLMSLGVDGR